MSWASAVVSLPTCCGDEVEVDPRRGQFARDDVRAAPGDRQDVPGVVITVVGLGGVDEQKTERCTEQRAAGAKNRPTPAPWGRAGLAARPGNGELVRPPLGHQHVLSRVHTASGVHPPGHWRVGIAGQP